MAKEYIDRERMIKCFCGHCMAEGTEDCIDCYDKKLIKNLPAADVVERAVYKQVAWERDTALAQLSDIGKGLGEKMDDVVEVVRCRECRYFCKGENDSESWEWCDCWKKDCWEDCYCACGQRRENLLYESLKRGLEEAIAFENGEIECRTETREDGDTW